MARLPSVGGDNGQWGQILNDFLSVELNSDGTLKKASDITTAQSTANSKYTKPGSGIPESDLDSSVQTKLNAGASGVPDATSSIKGKLQLTGDLTGTAASPQITAGAITDAKIALGANIGQNKIQNLPADLATKYEKPGSGIPASDLTASVQSAILQAGTAEQAANKGQAGGYAALDGGGKVPASQLPNSIMRYQGVWSASTNSPMLTDGSGEAGDVYRVTTAGTQNLGGGSITFNVGDYIVYNPSGVWEKSDTTDSVASVAGKTGVITLDKNDVGLNNVQNIDTTMRANHTGTQLASTISDFNFAADARITAQKGALGGVASLDGAGKIPGNQLPPLAITDTFTAANQAAQLALSAQAGDLAIRTDQGKTYVHNGGTAGDMTDWTELLSVGDQTTANSKVSKAGDTMTGGLVLTNAATSGLALYNTADQTTNYERLRFYWAGNAANLRMESSGTGTSQRDMVVGGVNNQLTISESTSAFTVNRNVTTSIPNILNVTAQIIAGSSGTQAYLRVGGTVAQTGTAGYTGLLVNTTETTTGSGTKLLADFQLANASKLNITNTGSVTSAATGKTALSFTDATTTTGITIGTDTNIYRAAADVLGTDDAIQAASYMVAYNASSNQVTLGRTAPGIPGPGVTFGSTQDVNLYRSGADTLKTDDTFYVNGEFWTNTHQSQRTVNTTNHTMTLFSGSIGNYPSFAPFGRFLWHDMLSFNLRWGTPTFERYNGTAWSSATLDTSIFALKEGASNQIIDGTTYTAARWTWNNSNVPYSYAAWWMIGIPYSGATAALKNITVESSSDGVNWTNRHTSTGNNSNGYPIAFPVADNGGDTYIRLTIVITNNIQLRISSMKALSARWGDQAGGQEMNYPYQWDSQGRMTIGSGTGGAAGTTVLSNGVLNIGGSTPTTAAQGIYFGTDVSLYRHSASNLKTDGNMRSGNGLIAKDTAPEQVTVGYISPGKGGISIGTANDTNLYRDGADVLKTDDAFVVGSDRLNIATSKTPASATAAGATGDIAWDADYVYVCVATNTWKRTPLSSW